MQGERSMEAEYSMQVRLSVPWNILQNWKAGSFLVHYADWPMIGQFLFGGRDIQIKRNKKFVATVK